MEEKQQREQKGLHGDYNRTTANKWSSRVFAF
jgi:hypothetical protein